LKIKKVQHRNSMSNYALMLYFYLPRRPKTLR
jgi:hypothetical protein